MMIPTDRPRGDATSPAKGAPTSPETNDDSRGKRGALIGAGIVVGVAATLIVIGALGADDRGTATTGTHPSADAAPATAAAQDTTTLPPTTTNTPPTTSTTTAPPSAPPAQHNRNVTEWVGLTYGSEYIDDWPYFVVGGELTDLASFAAPHYFGNNSEWNMAYFKNRDVQTAYAILGAPDGTIAAALEYDYADNEYVEPPLCWDEAFGPVVFTHDADTGAVLHAWYTIGTDAGVEFAHHPVPSTLTPNTMGVSGGDVIPSCSGR